MKLVMICIGFLYGNLIFSQEVFGEWKTIDEDTGVAKSIVEIYEKDGEVYGKVKKILREDKRDLRCTKCKGDLKNQKIEHMVILRGLSKKGEKYTGGKITDPEKGKTYDAKIWIEEGKPNTLLVRGYVAFFYRTQKWKRVEK
ncbi:DUF2147 domain-containing protein [Psychroflexus sp. YR1-1]|uniref:DUF2147 domain-containing protein n=1 Tax=Psychroflexus aurantiacus TaxID=2709310 RepID=A0A6B3QYI6_9FLAO|nr:DUF2147 domain-containing protein [Psychroflexus aurantiacus]NEV93246.1 DUF2147 domain-containing protein [Psychroflexus aurantiacus]